MTVTLKFNLPEDQEELTLAQKGNDYYFSLFDLDQELRKIIKYPGGDTEPLVAGLEHARDLLHLIIADHHVSLDDVS